jgi:gamma-glutamyltranspeptidase/glutathione hydrolase
MADVDAYVADPSAMRIPAEALLAADYLDERARSVDRDRAAAPSPGKPKGHETVYLAAADASGMMVSYIQSNFRGFGSGIVVPGTGIALHNRGRSFVLTPGHPNQVGPRKRPLNTIIPGFITRDGAPVAAFGVMGGEMQPQGHVQVALRMLAKGQNPQAAIDAPRWRIGPGELLVEDKWPSAFREALAARGHPVAYANPLDLGAAEIIWRNSDGGYVAAAESRRDAQAVGF